MKRGLILLMLLPCLCYGQSQLQDLLAASVSKAPSRELDRFNSYIHQLGLQQKEATSSALLYKVFKKTQRKYLKTYTTYADFSEVFSQGRYDCLTATALFSVVLRELHFSFDVLETNYHIFILAHTAEGDVLLETTDHIAGFVDRESEIKKRINSYQQTALTPSENKVYFEYSFSLFQEVNSQQLPGLLYYNQAVKAFNQHNLLMASSYLDRAIEIYESPRVAELAAVLVQSVLEGPYKNEIKYTVLQRYKKYVMTKNGPLASR